MTTPILSKVMKQKMKSSIYSSLQFEQQPSQIFTQNGINLYLPYEKQNQKKKLLKAIKSQEKTARTQNKIKMISHQNSASSMNQHEISQNKLNSLQKKVENNENTKLTGIQPNQTQNQQTNHKKYINFFNILQFANTQYNKFKQKQPVTANNQQTQQFPSKHNLSQTKCNEKSQLEQQQDKRRKQQPKSSSLTNLFSQLEQELKHHPSIKKIQQNAQYVIFDRIIDEKANQSQQFISSLRNSKPITKRYQECFKDIQQQLPFQSSISKDQYCINPRQKIASLLLNNQEQIYSNKLLASSIQDFSRMKLLTKYAKQTVVQLPSVKRMNFIPNDLHNVQTRQGFSRNKNGNFYGS